MGLPALTVACSRLWWRVDVERQTDWRRYRCAGEVFFEQNLEFLLREEMKRFQIATAGNRSYHIATRRWMDIFCVGQVSHANKV